MMLECRISVIIPCYNVAPWVERCLDSVFAALPADGEVIAIDDASADETLAILKKRARKDTRLQVIGAVHGGLSWARNRGLDVARGKFIFFVDADDTVESDYFTAMVEAAERDSADCCICELHYSSSGGAESLKGDYRFRTNDEIVAGFLPRIFGYSFKDVRAWYGGRRLAATRELAGVWRFVCRREIIETAHLRFDEKIAFYEDMAFISSYLLAASSMTCVKRPLYCQHLHSTGLMGAFPKDGLRYCRNKLELLRMRDALNRSRGGALTPLYEASCVFSALEILSYVIRRRIEWSAGWRIFREYLAEPSVRAALKGFPLSWKHPVLALGVLVLRRICVGHDTAARPIDRRMLRAETIAS